MAQVYSKAVIVLELLAPLLGQHGVDLPEVPLSSPDLGLVSFTYAFELVEVEVWAHRWQAERQLRLVIVP